MRTTAHAAKQVQLIGQVRLEIEIIPHGLCGSGKAR